MLHVFLGQVLRISYSHLQLFVGILSVMFADCWVLLGLISYICVSKAQKYESTLKKALNAAFWHC